MVHDSTAACLIVVKGAVVQDDAATVVCIHDATITSYHIVDKGAVIHSDAATPVCKNDSTTACLIVVKGAVIHGDIAFSAHKLKTTPPPNFTRIPTSDVAVLTYLLL